MSVLRASSFVLDRDLLKLKGKSRIAEYRLECSKSNGSSYTPDSPSAATGDLRHPTRGL